MKVLIDLNVFLDVEQQRQPFFHDSAAVLSASLFGSIKALLPPHALTTLFYLVEKHAGTVRAFNAVNWHLKHFTVPTLDHGVLSQAAVAGFTDYEDAVVACMAQREACAWIITRNVNDFKTSPVRAITPTDFLPVLASLQSSTP